MTVKPLVDKMKNSLSARTVNKYVEYVRLIVASLKNPETGEPIHYRKWDSMVMDLPVVIHKQQRRPYLKADAINQLVQDATDEEQVLYVLLAATGLRISEALAVEAEHFINHGRTIRIQQQVDRVRPRIARYLKTDAGCREVDLSIATAEYLRKYIGNKTGLLFKTRNNTPYFHNALESRWLTPRLLKMGLDEKGMGFHAFRRFRKTWLRGKRCQEDISNFWMGHKPKTMSELYSRMDEELDLRLQEAETVGVGFTIPANVAPKCSKKSVEEEVEVAA
jgi:integrase